MGGVESPAARGKWGSGAKPHPLGKFWLFQQKLRFLVIIFDLIHQQIALRLSENIHNFDKL